MNTHLIYYLPLLAADDLAENDPIHLRTYHSKQQPINAEPSAHTYFNPQQLPPRLLLRGGNNNNYEKYKKKEVLGKYRVIFRKKNSKSKKEYIKYKKKIILLKDYIKLKSK